MFDDVTDDVILRNVGGLLGDVIPLNLTNRLYIRFIQELSTERQPLHCDVIVGKQYFLIKLDRVSCTNYFMSIRNFRCSVHLIIIAKPDEKDILSKMLALKSTLYAS